MNHIEVEKELHSSRNNRIDKNGLPEKKKVFEPVKADMVNGLVFDNDEDFLVVTIAKYKLFIAHGAVGVDAFTMYNHLMFTAKMQPTKSVLAVNSYLMKGLSMSRARVQKAKALLEQFGLITPILRRDKKTGKIIGNFIKVKFGDVTFKAPEEKPEEYEDILETDFDNSINECLPSDCLPTGGLTDSRVLTTNALSNNLNSLSKNLNSEEAEQKERVEPFKKCKAHDNNQQFFTNGKLDKEKIFTFIKQHKKSVEADSIYKFWFDNKYYIDGKLIDIAAKIDEMHEQSLKAYNKEPAEVRKKNIEESNQQFKDSSGTITKQLLTKYIKNNNMQHILNNTFIDKFYSLYEAEKWLRYGDIFNIAERIDKCFSERKREAA